MTNDYVRSWSRIHERSNMNWVGSEIGSTLLMGTQMPLPTHIYHLAEAANWQSIQRHGLLSTSALLDITALPKYERDRYEQQRRSNHTELPSGIQIRDQKPLPPQALVRCLVGLTPSEWYQILNGKVFFWLDADRLNRQRRACEPRPQIVLIVDTERFLSRHAERIALSPINSGNARRRPAVRGKATFVPYAEWLESGWSSEARGLGTRCRTNSHRPVELTVEGSIRDTMEYVVDVQWLSPRMPFGFGMDQKAAPRPTAKQSCYR